MKKSKIIKSACALFLLIPTAALYTGCTILTKNGRSSPVLKNLTQKEAQLRSSIVESPEYDLFLKLDANSDFFSGETKIKFQAKRTDENLRIDFSDGKVLNLVVNDKILPIEYNGAFISIPHRFLSLGDNTITITYTHHYSKNGRGLHRFVDVEDQRVYLFSQFEPFDANRMFPCFDQPDLKATYKMSVEAPISWTVISAEREIDKLKINEFRQIWKFPKTDIFSTYIFSLHAGEYSVWESAYKSIPLRLFSRRSMAKYVKPHEWFGPTKVGLKFFPEYFGTPFPYNKYDQIIVPEASFGAMENVGSVTFNEIFISRGEKTLEQVKSLDSVIFHEMAHMWFGNLVTMKWWNDLWLNESFATFMATVALANTTEHNNTAWLGFNGTKEWAYWEDRLITTHPIVTPVENTDSAFANFDGITYGKGAASLKQLVYYIGEKKFKKGLELYFEKFNRKNTELKDFIATLSLAANTDLQHWQKLWLETSGVNTVSTQIECDTKRMLKSLSIEQSDNNTPPIFRPHKSNIVFIYSDAEIIKPQFFLDVFFKDSKNLIPLNKNIKCPSLVYPNYDDHAYLNVKLDSNSIKWLEVNISQVMPSNLLLSRMLWQDLWRMVQDGTYSVKAYADLGLKNIPSLKDPVLLKSVLKLQDIYYYLPKKTKVEAKYFNNYTYQVENQLWDIILSKKNSLNLRKEAFYLLTTSAQSQKILNNFAEILQSQVESEAMIESFSFDQDMRWMMAKVLTRNGYSGALDILEKEKARDHSNKGLKEYYSAKASWPEWSTKELWIKEFKNNSSEFSLDILRSIAQNIFPPNQTQYRTKYSKSFFMDLNKVIKSRDMSYASTFSALAPTFCEFEEHDLITKYLDQQNKLAPSISKRLKITRQESERCRSIRQYSRMKEVPQAKL